MKSVLFTLAVFMLLAELVSGHWYVKKCANKTENCRKKCKIGQMQTKPTSGMCPKLNCAVFQLATILVLLSVVKQSLQKLQEQ
ncbi:LOW QUALITY PROTEIN: beta-defensin 126 [Cynocephalus volans]|uniref:LOW QUALITY PROTEIN: beta-defensin 126 n=1 Tax=Cynocephalus volans TaxID=110931 RepID=UPI002FC675B7